MPSVPSLARLASARCAVAKPAMAAATSAKLAADASAPAFHRLLAAAGEHNVEATDAFASMRLGEARDEAFLTHLQPTYDLSKRGGKILSERQEALDAANAKKAFNERLVAREDPAVVEDLGEIVVRRPGQAVHRLG